MLVRLYEVSKSNFLKKKPFSCYRAVPFKISHICCNQSTIKKCELKGQEIRNIYFIKKNAEKNGTFQMQIMLKGGNKHAKIICDTCSKLSIWVLKQRHMFSI